MGMGTPPPAVLPFGWDVLLLLCKRAEAVVSEEGLPVIPDEALDALAPPARVSVAAALEHQGPVAMATGKNREHNCVSATWFTAMVNGGRWIRVSKSHQPFHVLVLILILSQCWDQHFRWFNGQSRRLKRQVVGGADDNGGLSPEGGCDADVCQRHL